MKILSNLVAEATKVASNWYSEDTEDDPKPLPFVCGYNILVKPLKVKSKVGSIHLPDQTREDVQQLTNVARVLKVGPEAYKDSNRFTAPWCKEGDYVVFQKFRGVKIAYKGVPLTLIADDEVLMVVPDPSDVNNNMFNFTKASS